MEIDGTTTATFRSIASWLTDWLAIASVSVRLRGARAYRSLARLRDRATHPWRRRRALARLARTRPARRIVVVCYGNVCRSPFAAALLERLVTVPVVSAGFLAPGRPVPPTAAAAAGERGIDLTGHRSQLVTRDLLESADLALVMDVAQGKALRRAFPTSRCEVIVLGDVDPEARDARTIADPWSKSLSEFNEVYGRIERCCRAVASTIAR